MFVKKNSLNMEVLNQNNVENILIGMGVTYNTAVCDRIKKRISINDFTRKEGRVNDCYATVAKYIKQLDNTDGIDDCNIFFYAIGNKTAHCVLKDNRNNIIADDFSKSRTYYNSETNEVIYSNIELGSDNMGKSYNSGDNSFTIKVGDFKKLFGSDEMVKLLTDRRRELAKDNEKDSKRNIIQEILKEIPVNKIINDLKKESLLQSLKKQDIKSTKKQIKAKTTIKRPL